MVLAYALWVLLGPCRTRVIRTAFVLRGGISKDGCKAIVVVVFCWCVGAGEAGGAGLVMSRDERRPRQSDSGKTPTGAALGSVRGRGTGNPLPGRSAGQGTDTFVR